MGKTYIIGEYSEKYLKKLKAEERYGTTGILLGQVTPMKTYIIFAAQTPLKDQAELPPDNPDEMNASDIEWVSEHARQVARMLPGGILVLGVFLIRPAKMSKEEAQDIFRKLTSTVETAVAKERLWNFSEEEPPERIVLQVYADSKKMKLRAYDIHNPLTPTKLLDCKSSNLSSAWQLVEATVNVDIHIPVTTADNQFDKDSLKGLNAWAKHMMQSSYLINGHYKDPESIISEGAKKKSPMEVQFLSAPATVSSDDTSALIRICTSSIAVKGTVRCRAYLHGSKTKVKDGILSLKRDVLNTVFVRCEMVFEDQILNRNADAGDSTSHKAPHRVFASILPSSVAFCDYGFSDEGSKDLEERFKELLDYDLHPAQLDRTEEVLLEEMGIDTGPEQEQAPLKEEEEEIADTGFKYTGMAAAAGVGVIAVAASVIYYFIGAAI